MTHSSSKWWYFNFSWICFLSFCVHSIMLPYYDHYIVLCLCYMLYNDISRSSRKSYVGMRHFIILEYINFWVINLLYMILTFLSLFFFLFLFVVNWVAMSWPQWTVWSSVAWSLWRNSALVATSWLTWWTVPSTGSMPSNNWSWTATNWPPSAADGSSVSSPCSIWRWPTTVSTRRRPPAGSSVPTWSTWTSLTTGSPRWRRKKRALGRAGVLLLREPVGALQGL